MGGFWLVGSLGAWGWGVVSGDWVEGSGWLVAGGLVAVKLLWKLARFPSWSQLVYFVSFQLYSPWWCGFLDFYVLQLCQFSDPKVGFDPPAGVG